MTAIESKEEISDTDSGIILHSGKNNISKKQYKYFIFASVMNNLRLRYQYKTVVLLVLKE